MTNVVGIEAPPELAALVEQLRGLAASNGLSSERTLAEQLNVKRHQLRRALQMLRTSGEIAPAEPKRNGIGLRNGESLIRETNPMEVIEMRIAVEPFLARLSALRASPLEIARINRAATTLAGTDSAAADLRFHRAIAAGSGNRLAESLYTLLRQVASDPRIRICRSSPGCSVRIQRRDEEHRSIADAISRRDADAAEHAMKVHLAEVQKRVIDKLNPLAAAG